jgi:drug/metabolite transporter (DMT)-like permease
VLWDYLIFGLRLDAWQLAGLVLALIGIYFGLRSASRRKLS